MGLCQERLETHHITPKAKSEKWEPENDPNRGLNLITLCLGAHSRIHPNLIESRKRIPKGIEQINRCIKLNRQGKPYHNTDWDEQMRQLAIDNEIALANLSVEEAWKE